MFFQFIDGDHDDGDDDKLCAAAAHWPCQAKEAISNHQVRSTLCHPMTHVRTERWWWWWWRHWWWRWWRVWLNQYTAHNPPCDARLAAFFIPVSPLPCFVAKKSITRWVPFPVQQSHFNLLNWAQSTRLSCFPITRHAPRSYYDQSSCDCLVLSCHRVTFHSLHKTWDNLRLTVNSNRDASDSELWGKTTAC